VTLTSATAYMKRPSISEISLDGYFALETKRKSGVGFQNGRGREDPYPAERVIIGRSPLVS
jgi:hypothetical protein